MTDRHHNSFDGGQIFVTNGRIHHSLPIRQATFSKKESSTKENDPNPISRGTPTHNHNATQPERNPIAPTKLPVVQNVQGTSQDDKNRRRPRKAPGSRRPTRRSANYRARPPPTEEPSLEQRLTRIETVLNREIGRIGSWGEMKNWQRHVLRSAFGQLNDVSELMGRDTWSPLTAEQLVLVGRVREAMDEVGRVMRRLKAQGKEV